MIFITVDDELLVLNNLTQILKEIEPKAYIYEFSSPKKALEFAKENIIDIAFLDIEMSSVSGIELAKKLKEIYNRTNIVFVTGYSQYAFDAFSVHASGYILKPVSEESIEKVLLHLAHPLPKRVAIGLNVKTFGNFEVFMNQTPVYFSRNKSKELFAYLIHKKGAGCTSKEIASVLFEDKPYSISLQKQVQTIISAMLKTLNEIGVSDVINKKFNHIAVDVTKINCDYYRFLNYEPEAVNEYMGEYMSNYSWAEFTIGDLDNLQV